MTFATEKADLTGKSQLSKVPQVTFLFWVIKILCTTLGETGGDAVTMSMNLGYLVGTAIFAAIFLVFVVVQVKAKKFHPLLYWTTIIATTTVGTTMADFADRSLGIGYAGGSLTLLGLLLASLGLWYWSLGSVSVNTVNTPKVEAFYWVTIMFSQTLGTALGDWAAFILTRPLGAVVGDLLDKPLDHGGLNLSRYSASAALVVLVFAFILIFPQKAGQHPKN